MSDAIPDLDFWTPDCPVCDRSTDFDSDQFVCSECRIAWPRNGYGSQAERWEA